MAILGMVPGMPHLVFIALSAGSALFGVLVLRRQTVVDSPEKMAEAKIAAEAPKELGWDDLDQNHPGRSHVECQP